MGINILIVEDSSVMRSMISKTIQISGVNLNEIHQAANGKEGLEGLDQHWIDLVIADINMPVMNGEEMIDRILAHPEHKKLPIIVISNEGSQTRIERLQQKGAVFIQKPFSPEKVRDVLKQLLGEEVFNGSGSSENTFDSGA
jgi:two-component system chemotaxis response regulator CheY